MQDAKIAPAHDDPEARALRLTEKLRGLMKEEFAAYGGGEAFLRWVRSDHEDPAPSSETRKNSI
jgi:hypothetical protein